VRRETLEAAIAEAERFLCCAQRLRDAVEPNDCEFGYWNTPRMSGAVRRASRDLTRALADMRRPM
jgi:hypothetical protein